MAEWVHVKDADGIAQPIKTSDLMLEKISALMVENETLRELLALVTLNNE